MNERLLFWLILGVLSFLIPWLYKSGANADADEASGVLAFRASMAMRAALVSSAAFILFLMIGFLVSLGFQETWPGQLLGLLLLITAIIGWPSTITLNNYGVCQSRLFRKPKVIEWHEVEGMEYNSTSSRTIVKGRSGIEIVHSGFHVARDRFRREISARTKKP